MDDHFKYYKYNAQSKLLISVVSSPGESPYYVLLLRKVNGRELLHVRLSCVPINLISNFFEDMDCPSLCLDEEWRGHIFPDMVDCSFHIDRTETDRALSFLGARGFLLCKVCP